MLFTLFILPLVSAVSLPHEHHVARGLPATWHQHEDHPVYNLFRRDTAATAVGSQEWLATYPKIVRGSDGYALTPDKSILPAEWKAALDAAVKDGRVPNIPPGTGPRGGVPTYPQGFDPLGNVVCSATYKQCHNPDDIWDGPANMFGTSFDDGPTEFTPDLLAFLKQNNEKATHFTIGVQVLGFPQNFLATLNAGDDIAVHTWTHPSMTTLSNEDILSELGWTMQIIHDSSGGRVPKYWRPPYGDSDNRVRAIAKEVFGLTTIIWNYDTHDYDIPSNLTTTAAVMANVNTWVNLPKSTGIILLEHETSQESVNVFKNTLPLFKSHGWQTQSLVQLFGGPYSNAQDNTGAVTPAGIIASGSGSSGNGGNASNLTLATTAATSTGSSRSQTTQNASGGSSDSPKSPGAAGRISVGASTILIGLLGLLATILL